MILYHILQYSLLLLICSYLVNYYAAKTVSFHIKFWSVITWTLNFSIALLAPQDVYETLNRNSQDITQYQEEVKYLGWQYVVLYWLVYLLTWTVIPVLQEWQNSGDIQSKDRLKRSLKVNGIFYLWMLVGAIIFLALLIWLNAGGEMGLITFLKCLATIWGFLLLMSLMGYALVQIPKTLWNNADPTTFLTYLYFKTNNVQDELQEAYQQFTKVVGYILYVQNELSKKKIENSEQIRRYCSQSMKIIPSQYEQKINRRENYLNFLDQIGYLKDYPISLQNSIEHLRLLKRSIAHCSRLQKSFDYYVTKAILYEDILTSTQKQDNIKALTENLSDPNLSEKLIGTTISIEENLNKFRQTRKLQFFESGEIRLKTILFNAKWYHTLWYLKVRRHFNRVLAVIIGTGSVILLISETQVFLSQQTSILGWLLSIKNYEVLRVIVCIVIIFIMYMVNYSLFRLKFSNLYGLYAGNSDGPSLMFATVNFSRVGVVIVLNFFDMMKMNSVYQTVMGTVNMGLLGEWVIRGLPALLWLIVLTHYFNIWSKIMSKLKLNDSMSFANHDTKSLTITAKNFTTVQKRRGKIQKENLNKQLIS